MNGIKVKRRWLVLLACLLCVGCVFMANPSKAFADDISVYVGYPGGPYYEKHHYSDAELQGMVDGYLYQYSSFDSGGFLRKGYGKGVRLDNIFTSAGVNPWSLWRFHFGTGDGYIADDGGYGIGSEAWTYASLGATRYYFDGFPRYYNFDGRLTADQEARIWNTASAVPTIIATTSSFDRVQGPDDAHWTTPTLGTQRGNRLMFGQVTPTSADARMSAHSVNSITCIMGGVPTIGFGGVSALEGKVGDSFTITPTLTANDELVAALGVRDINWSSGNEDIASVVKNPDGSITITINGEGNVSINASFGNSPIAEFVSTAGLGLTGSGKGSGDGDGDGDGNGEGDGKGDGKGNNGDGDGDGENGGDGDGQKGDGNGSSGDGDSKGDGAGDGEGSTQIEVTNPGGDNGQSQNPANAEEQPPGDIAESADALESLAAVTTSLPKGMVATKLNIVDIATALSDGGSEGGGGGGSGGGGSVELGALVISAVGNEQALVYATAAGTLFLAGGIKRISSFERSKDRYARKRQRRTVNAEVTDAEAVSE